MNTMHMTFDEFKTKINETGIVDFFTEFSATGAGSVFFAINYKFEKNGEFFEIHFSFSEAENLTVHIIKCGKTPWCDFDVDREYRDFDKAAQCLKAWYKGEELPPNWFSEIGDENDFYKKH